MDRLRRRVLGIPVGITGEAAVLAIARDALAAWPATRARPLLRLRFEAGEGGPGPLRYDVRGDRLRIGGAGVRAWVDAGRGRARIRLAPAALAEAAHMRYGVFEASLLFLATARDRIPFHAAGLVRDGRAVLLAGPSGAGKSTLALAALHHGSHWRLLSEDCVYLETRRRRVWGWPGFLHVAPDARRFFDGLSGLPVVRMANGKTKIAVRDTGPSALRASTRRAALLLLDRTSAGPSLEPLPDAGAAGALLGRLEPGFDRFGGSMAAALGLVAGRIWRFDAGPDPAAAIAFLEVSLQTLASQATLPPATD